MIELAAGDYRLVLEPARGGSIARFDWRGEPLLRPTGGPSIFDTACFPLVPFSNRIAHGRFRCGGREVVLAPNFPGSDNLHPLHGFGWLAAWAVVTHSAESAVLRHLHAAGEWPWNYAAEQSFTLDEGGLSHELSLTNLGDTPMPAGLGFHPYFPRNGETLYCGMHHGQWRTSADGLPLVLDSRGAAIDWWGGQPVGSRLVDTLYTGREGPLAVLWPERGIALEIAPSDNLGCTVVYTPPGADYFCVEPVSHMTDAINRPDGGDAMPMLGPGDTLSAAVRYSLTPAMTQACAGR